MKEHTIKDWNELNDYLFSDTWNPSINRHRSTFAYRGVARESFSLSTSLSRLGKPYPNMERNLLKQFQKYAPREIVERNTDWHWLSVAQHHGLPTRLLDWTYSPFIALHFATCDLNNHPGEAAAVWKVNYSQVHDLLQRSETAELRRLGARIFSIDALSATLPTLEDLDNRASSSYQIAVFFEPPSINDRIVNQFAYFSAISDPQMTFEDWLKLPHVNKTVDAIKIVIPDTLKWEVRDKLDQSNINERIIMPGLDGLCAWLKRHYQPR
ncbi:MAG: FRG domain-containing protein [Bacteroidota bacterium]